MLLLDYICSQRVKHGKMPADPVMVKTIVTMDMGEQIATHYGLRTIWNGGVCVKNAGRCGKSYKKNQSDCGLWTIWTET